MISWWPQAVLFVVLNNAANIICMMKMLVLLFSACDVFKSINKIKTKLGLCQSECLIIVPIFCFSFMDRFLFTKLRTLSFTASTYKTMVYTICILTKTTCALLQEQYLPRFFIPTQKSDNME